MTVNTHGASNRYNRQRATFQKETWPWRTVNADVMGLTGRQDESSPIKLGANTYIWPSNMDNMLQTSLKSLLPLNIDKYNECKWRLVAVKFFSQCIIYMWCYLCHIYDALSELIRALTYVHLKWITAQSQRNKFLERMCRSTTRCWEVYWANMI